MLMAAHPLIAATPSGGQRIPSPGKTSYHINPATGDDTSNGLDKDHAWKTFRRINLLQLAPGDRVEIDAPGSFDQTLALAGAGTTEAPVEIRFAAGRYDFHPENMYREAYQISNTNDVPDGPKAVGILLAGAQHFRLSGPAATIVCRGKMIEVCVDACEDIGISGLTFDYHRPTVSEFKVAAVGDGHVDLAIHKDSAYTIKDGVITWQGEGWSYQTGLAQELDPSTGDLHRRRDPLQGLKLRELEPFLIRASGKLSMEAGNIYQIRDTLRDCAGVFTRRSRDITWKNVTFRFLHGMGHVNQFSENLTFDSVVIAPDETSGRTTAAWADCLHISACKGKVLVKNCEFSGAHDDAINVHGTYLRIVEKLSDHKLKVRFMHKQTFGFMAFNPGDEIELIHADSMVTYGTNRVTESTLQNPKELLLTLEKPIGDDLNENDVIENVTWTPEVEIRGCKVSHIPTRGFLISTPRKVLVEDNEFLATHMSAIQVAGDAQGWFESGAVRDMTLRENRFIRCGTPVIHIDPSNRASNSAMHRNIRILNNEFVLAETNIVKAKSTTGLRVADNRILAKGELDDARAIKTSDCEGVQIEGNTYKQSSKE
jgi:hypothetical protein